jgi:hypothetical protein
MASTCCAAVDECATHLDILVIDVEITRRSSPEVDRQDD